MTTPAVRHHHRDRPASPRSRPGRARRRPGRRPRPPTGRLDAAAVGHRSPIAPRTAGPRGRRPRERAMRRFEPAARPRPGRASSSPRRRTASRTSSRSVTAGWPPLPSRSIAAPRRSWPSTCRRRRRSQITVQASGDAHLSNFGLFASPERTLVFDSNDFDETLPGPWEWDVKRLAASVVIAARANGFSAAAHAHGCRWPRSRLSRADGALLGDAPARHLVRPDDRGRHRGGGSSSGKPSRSGSSRKDAKARLDAIFSKARGKDQMKASGSLTEIVDGHWRIVDDPPVVTARRDPRRRRDPREDVQRLPGDPRREPPRARRALPVRRLRAQGRRRRQRRHALLRRPARGPRRGRPALPPGQGGDRVGPRPVSRVEPPQQPRRARRRRPAADAGDARHLPRLDARTGRPRLLLPPAVGHEGLGRHRDPAPAGHGLLRRHLRPVAGAGPRAERRLDRDRGVPRHVATRSTGRSPTSPRRTPTRTRRTTPPSRTRSPTGRSRPPPADPSGRGSALARAERGSQRRDLRPLAGHFGAEARQLIDDRGDPRRVRGPAPARVRASSAGSSGVEGETSRLARMLARAPMIPMPANMTKTPVSPPSVVTG